MVYSEDFKKRARELYPDNEILHKALEDGDDVVVNNILYTALGENFSPETVLNTSPSELRKLAEDMISRKALFGEWLMNYNC